MDKWFDENERQNHNPHVRLVLYFVFLIAIFFNYRLIKHEKVKYTITQCWQKRKFCFVELLVVASSKACSRLWMIAGTTHFWRTSFCPSCVSCICLREFNHSSVALKWKCTKTSGPLNSEQQFFLRAVVIVQEDADGILQKRPNCS